MSFVEMLSEGVTRAVQLAPLVFVLNAPTPAAAQLPRAVPVAASAQASAPVLDPVLVSTHLRLVSTYMDIRINDGEALVHTVLVYRNDDTVPVQAHYALPQPARLIAHRTGTGPVALVADVLSTDEYCGGEAESDTEADAFNVDARYEQEQFVEAGEPLPPQTHAGTVTVEPGEEITIEFERPGLLLVRNDRYRMVLPLLTDRHAAYTPQFAAAVTVANTHPIRSFVSATHGGEVQGLGERVAVLSIGEGRVFEGQHFAIEFEVDRRAVKATAQTASWDGLNWGGETRGLRITRTAH